MSLPLYPPGHLHSGEVQLAGKGGSWLRIPWGQTLVICMPSTCWALCPAHSGHSVNAKPPPLRLPYSSLQPASFQWAWSIDSSASTEHWFINPLWESGQDPLRTRHQAQAGDLLEVSRQACPSPLSLQRKEKLVEVLLLENKSKSNIALFKIVIRYTQQNLLF